MVYLPCDVASDLITSTEQLPNSGALNQHNFRSGKFVCMCPILMTMFMVHEKNNNIFFKYVLVVCSYAKVGWEISFVSRLAGSWHSRLANLSSTITHNWSAGVRCKTFNPVQVRKTRDLIWQLRWLVTTANVFSARWNGWRLQEAGPKIMASGWVTCWTGKLAAIKQFYN